MNNLITSKLKTLLDLTSLKESDNIKLLLETEPTESKGLLFENFLAELYKGNGWLSSVQGGRGDAGADILLYHPDTPSKVSLIIQAKNHKNKLSFDNTKIELVKFEDQATVRYNCTEYSLFSINGYVEKAEKLAEFNMALHSWGKIKSLIQSYDPKLKKPTLELLAHNQSTYNKISSLFKKQQRVSCVQATGTGKSYLIAQNIINYYPSTSLVLAPSHYILRQQERLLPGLKGCVIYMTYARAANVTLEEWTEINPTLIVLDEFHRAGASQWGAGIQRLFDSCPDAKIFGTSATHIRYLDNARNMVDELFDGTMANELNLQDAIAREILPSPYYVSALYTLDDELNLLNKDISNCNKSEKEKKYALNELEKIRVDWETSSGISDILSKHLSVISGKYIVFCENIEHLDIMRDEVSKWFRKAAEKHGERINRHQYIIESSQTDRTNDRSLKSFEESDSKKTIHLLFAVNMLNEGLHIKDVNGVLLLRKTQSPIIYFQQIGRCFHSVSGAKPIIFDLVNNTQNVNATSFQETLDEAIKKENSRRDEIGLKNNFVTCHIIDETIKFVNALNVIEKRLGLDLNNFERALKQLVEFKEIYGHCRVEQSYKTKEGVKLGYWAADQRKFFKSKSPSLTAQRFEQLENLDFEWDLFEADFQNGILELIKFRKIYGHCRVDVENITENGFKFGSWVARRRNDYKTKNVYLTKSRIKQLDDLGFLWELTEIDFHIGLTELIKYKDIYGNCRVESKFISDNGFNLGTWVAARRNDYKTKNVYLTKSRIKQLDDLGFDWDPLESDFQNGMSELRKFKQIYGHCRVQLKYTTEDGFNLGKWTGHRRTNYKTNNKALTKQRIEQLEALGFQWDLEEALFSNGLDELIAFINDYGHCRVENRFISKTGFNLGNWVSNRRKDYKTKNVYLTKSRFQRLDDLGFTWDSLEENFQSGISELVKFKTKYGHCRVKTNYITNTEFKLGNWITRRRKDYKTKAVYLTKSRFQQLDDLGLIWDSMEEYFHDGLSELAEYYKVHGNCIMKAKYIANSGFKLGQWTSLRRQEYKYNKMSLTKERINELNKFNFEWDLEETEFQKHFFELVKFKDINGNCNVPYKITTENGVKLGQWVSSRRKYFKNKKMSQQHIKQLEEIGFVWKLGKRN